MNKKSRLKLLFKSLFVQFGSVKTDEGLQLLWDEDTELIVGYNVYIEQETESGDIEYVAAPDGEYHSNDTVFVIEGGKCVEIKNAEPEAPAETSEENLEDQPEATQDPEPETDPEPESDPEPEFDAQKAIEDLRAEYDAKFEEMEGRLTAMKEQLDALLALPQDENAFEKESKNDNQKPLFKTKK